jgi:hypothetical protein
MNLKSGIISALILFIVTSFFMSCRDDYYPKVPEVLYIKNNTGNEFYVKYGFTDSIPNAYLKNIQLIDTLGWHSYYEFEKSMITDLWMSESKFNELVSQISIYRIQHNDTSYVNPKYYNKKSAWEHNVEYIDNIFSNNNQLTSSYNQLTVCDSMFTK